MRLRPSLFRYCTRLVGSIFDGEDVVQEALLKAIESYPGDDIIENVDAWMFRIAHNTALDHLRRRSRVDAIVVAHDEESVADPIDEIELRQSASASLQAFMRLSPSERSCVILMDVIGYSLREISEIIGSTIPATKAALHRGRLRLSAATTEEAPAPVLSESDAARLGNYVRLFNARDFDAIRNLLAEDVRLDLVSRFSRTGKARVSEYFTAYSGLTDWLLVSDIADGRPVMFYKSASQPEAKPTSVVLLDWSGERVTRIRDYYHASHVLEALKT